MGVILIALLLLCSRCTLRAYELRTRHSALIPLLPLSLAFRVAVLGYMGLNYAVYQHLVWFRSQSVGWTVAAWIMMSWHVGLLAAYLFFPHTRDPRYEFTLASMFLDERTNTQLRSLKTPTIKQRLAIFWPFVGLFHNHIYGIIVATLQPNRASVSFVSSVAHAADSRVALGVLVGLSLLQIALFAFLRPYSSRFKTRITFFSLVSSALCLCLLLAYTMQRDTTPDTAPMILLTFNSITSILSFCLLTVQAVRELVGDENLKRRCPCLAIFYRAEEKDPLLA